MKDSDQSRQHTGVKTKLLENSANRRLQALYQRRATGHSGRRLRHLHKRAESAVTSE